MLDKDYYQEILDAYAKAVFSIKIGGGNNAKFAKETPREALEASMDALDDVPIGGQP